MKKYSSATGGFYDTEIHGPSIPIDAIPLSDEDWVALINAQSENKEIKVNEDGRPTAVPREHKAA